MKCLTNRGSHQLSSAITRSLTHELFPTELMKSLIYVDRQGRFVSRRSLRDTRTVEPRMALEFARQGARSPRQEGMACCMGEECNEIGFKFSPDYYLSTTVEYH
ncbi:hypothetical protein AVEN_185458-1 [Araneus ventricosus]|uniref:Uncharacterized protein n=1 Tax=Araneus ventricosus TaxID=182803 RepID=A0A4Y2UH33_ARAVE|nr:hypothetical protein AVEN_185458-1 [Araneus ventricosus]